jgi:hypothetical protein
MEKKYWVEADRAVKDRNKVIGYSVWHQNNGRQRVRKFAISRKGGADVALHLANMLRDDMNNGVA